jgi:hypothetical protein
MNVGPISTRQLKSLVNPLALADRRDIIKSTSGSDIVSELLDERGKLIMHIFYEYFGSGCRFESRELKKINAYYAWGDPDLDPV